MQINPYDPGNGQHGDAGQLRGRSLLIKICAVITFMVCTPLGLLACWAWWLWWKNQRVTAAVGSFPYRQFAWESTQWAVVALVGFLALWSVFWCTRWFRKRSTDG